MSRLLMGVVIKLKTMLLSEKTVVQAKVHFYKSVN